MQSLAERALDCTHLGLNLGAVEGMAVVAYGDQESVALQSLAILFGLEIFKGFFSRSEAHTQ